MRFSGFVSLLFVLSSCASSYRFHQVAAGEHSANIKVIQPAFNRQLYRCEVNGRFAFRKFHLSGLLYFRNLSDTAIRVVFQNELGITYFDFGWDKNNRFHVFHIIDQMNQPALIKTLQKDFEVILGKNVQPNPTEFLDKSGDVEVLRHGFYAGYVYYYSLKEKPDAVFQVDYGTEKKALVRFRVFPSIALNHPVLADSLAIRHYRAGFSILLKKISNDG